MKPASKKAVALHYALSTDDGCKICIACKKVCESQPKYERHNGGRPAKSFRLRHVETSDVDAFYDHEKNEFNLDVIDNIWPPSAFF